MTKPRSIQDFIRLQRQRKCVVCAKLTPELQQQISTAQRSARVKLETVLAWLKAEHGIVFTPQQWQAHTLGRHRVQR